MRVFLPPNDRGAMPVRHTMHVAPAADRAGQECPADWVDRENKPVSFAVVFAQGEALVPDPLGRYLLERGLARKHRSTLVAAA